MGSDRDAGCSDWVADFSGAILQFDYETSEQVLQLLRNVKKHRGRKLADQLGSNADDPAIINAMSQSTLLRAAAPMITMSWLINAIDREQNPPVTQNAEAEELMFCTLHYPLPDHVDPNDVRSALDRCTEFRRESPTFWNWRSMQKSAKAAPKSKNFRSTHTFFTKLDDGSLVLGGLKLKGKSLILSVNSQGRADRGRALLSKLLHGLVGEPLVEIQTLDQVIGFGQKPFTTTGVETYNRRTSRPRS